MIVMERAEAYWNDQISNPDHGKALYRLNSESGGFIKILAMDAFISGENSAMKKFIEEMESGE